MKNVVYAGLIVIFLSMLFTLFVFDSFSRAISQCAVDGCSDMNMFFTMLFGLFIGGAIVLMDVLIANIILKQSLQEVVKQMPKRKPGIAALKKEVKRIDKMKADAEKQYYKGSFDADTFKKLLNKYEQRKIELKSRIAALKPSKPKSKGNKRK